MISAGFVLCPQCSASYNIESILPNSNGTCASCQSFWTRDNHILKWKTPDAQPVKITAQSLLKKFRNQFSLTSNYLLPFRYISKIQVERFYQKTLSDKELAQKWGAQYLNQLKINPGDRILDFGCGRGRNIGICDQLGYQTFGQDIQNHSWWKKLSNTQFQVVPAHFSKLPWNSGIFSAVLSFSVVHYINQQVLPTSLEEIFRVLKPGGYLILWEGNDHSYGAREFRKQIGSLYSMPYVRKLCEQTGFKELSLSYEGFYAPIFPIFINFIRQLFSKNFDIADYGSFCESLLPIEKRGKWLITLQRPE